MKKHRAILLAILATAVMGTSGCGYIDRKLSGWTGNASKSCIDGVTYLQFTSGATVQVDRKGVPVPCGKDVKG